MRIRIDLLSLLRTITKIAAQVAAVGELAITVHQQSQQQTGGAESNALDLDAVRTQTQTASSSSSVTSSAPASSQPATGYPNDPSAAH